MRRPTTAACIEQIGVAAVQRERPVSSHDRNLLNDVVHTRNRFERLTPYAYEPSLQETLNRIVETDSDTTRKALCKSALLNASNAYGVSDALPHKRQRESLEDENTRRELAQAKEDLLRRVLIRRMHTMRALHPQ